MFLMQVVYFVTLGLVVLNVCLIFCVEWTHLCCPVTLCRSTGDQSKDYVALGPKWKDWPQKASARPCQHCGTQRRDLAHHPHFRAERWQTRTASHASAGSHCLRGKCLRAVGDSFGEDPCRKGVVLPKKLSGSWGTGKKSCCAVPGAVSSWVGFRALPWMKGPWFKACCKPAKHTLQWRWDDESEREYPCPSALSRVVFYSMHLGTLGHNLSDLEAFVWEGFSALDVFTLYHLLPVCSWQHRVYIPHTPPRHGIHFGLDLEASNVEHNV